jgi:hypothetical protein
VPSQVTQPLLDALDTGYATGATATAFLALQVRGSTVYRTWRTVQWNALHSANCAGQGCRGTRRVHPCPARLQSCMNHSCDPNCTAAAEDGCARVSLVATRPIAAGEELTISYIDVSLPYKERRCVAPRLHRPGCGRLRGWSMVTEAKEEGSTLDVVEGAAPGISDCLPSRRCLRSFSLSCVKASLTLSLS